MTDIERASAPPRAAAPAEAGGSSTIPESRRRLPNRRPHLGEAIEWRGKLWELRVGIDDRAIVREVFCIGPKAGSDTQAYIDDACVVISRGLQHGDTIQGMADGITREPTRLDDPAASLIGLIVAVAARIERELQTQVGEADGSRHPG